MKFKKLFLLMPLAFLALTGCAEEGTNGGAGGDTGGNGGNGGNGGGEQTATEFTLATPEDGKEYYIGINRLEGNSFVGPGYYFLTGEMGKDKASHFMDTEKVADATAEIKKAKKVLVTKAEGEGNWNLKIGDKYISAETNLYKGDVKLNAIYSTTAKSWHFDEAGKTFTTVISYETTEYTVGLNNTIGGEKIYKTIGAEEYKTGKIETNYWCQLFTK